jgi:hypothetical protein
MGKTEIGEQWFAFCIEQDIPWLDVPMKNPVLVRNEPCELPLKSIQPPVDRRGVRLTTSSSCRLRQASC